MVFLPLRNAILIVDNAVAVAAVRFLLVKFKPFAIGLNELALNIKLNTIVNNLAGFLALPDSTPQSATKCLISIDKLFVPKAGYS